MISRHQNVAQSISSPFIIHINSINIMIIMFAARRGWGAKKEGARYCTTLHTYIHNNNNNNNKNNKNKNKNKNNNNNNNNDKGSKENCGVGEGVFKLLYSPSPPPPKKKKKKKGTTRILFSSGPTSNRKHLTPLFFSFPSFSLSLSLSLFLFNPRERE